MTRVGFVRNDRCLELQRLVNLTELSPDPDCMMFVKDLIMEGRKRGIGVRHKLTQLEVLGEVYAQFYIPCHQREWKIQDKPKKVEKHKIFYGLRMIDRPEPITTLPITTLPITTLPQTTETTTATPITTYLPRRTTETMDVDHSTSIDTLTAQYESVLLPLLRNLVRQELTKRPRI